MPDVQPLDNRQETAVAWTLGLSDLATDHGLHPALVPYGGFSVAAGVDGRVNGSCRRHLGFTQWMDIMFDPDARDKIWRAVDTDPGKNANSYGIVDMFPFAVRSRAGDKYRYGVILYQLLDHERPGEGGLLLFAAKDSDAHDLADPYQFDFYSVNNNKPQGDVDGFQQVGVILSWPSIAYSGYYIYVGSADEHLPMTIWYATGFVTDLPVLDLMGVPVKRALYTTVDATTTTGGLAIAGQYKFAGRLVDTQRSRLTNVGYAPAADGSPDPQNSPTFTSSNNTTYGRVVLNSYPSNAYYLGWYADSESGLSRSFWDRYQIVVTLSSLDATKPGGGIFYVVDEMAVNAEWLALSTEDAGRADVFINAARSETYAGTPVRQPMPTTDDANAASFPIDFLQDEYLDWFQLAYCYGMAHWKGLTVQVVNLRSNVAGSPNDVGDLPGGLDLVWSETRFFAPENFSLSNAFRTGYSVPPIMKTQDDLAEDIELYWNKPLVSFAEGSDYLYLMADGPVYRLERTDTGVFVRQVGDNIKLLSRNSVATSGQLIMVGAEQGFFFLDGATGSFSKIDALDRLVRDRWGDPKVRRELQMAYDGIMDSFYILCPAAAEIVEVNLSTSRITMHSGANFSLVRTAPLPTAQRAVVKRALFMTWLGKLVVPTELKEESLIGQPTMHGLTKTPPWDGDYSAVQFPNQWVFRVVDATYDAGAGVTELQLDENLTGALAETYTPPAILGAGITVAFLDGIYKNEIHQCSWNDIGDMDDWRSTEARILVLGDVSATGVVGSYVALSPVPLLLVGGPLAGDDARLFLQRKLVQVANPVAVKVWGRTASLGYVPLYQIGVTESYNCLATEPISVPSEIFLRPDAGALPFWVDLGDDATILTDVPVAGQTYSTTKPWENYVALGEEEEGVSTNVPLPVLVSLVSDIGWDLVELVYEGKVLPSMKSRG